MVVGIMIDIIGGFHSGGEIRMFVGHSDEKAEKYLKVVHCH